MAAAGLREKGWHLSVIGIEECKDERDKSVQKIIQNAKDTDLKTIGEGWLPEEISRGRCEYIQGPGVLQIQKIRNVSAPKDNEESHAAPRLLKLTLTDGQINCNAVETEKLDKIGLNTPPGTKICLKGTVGVEHGFLLLSSKNTVFVGGRVEKLAENWELKKMLSKQIRVNVGTEGGPPPYVPFGQRIRENKPQPVNKRDNFKSFDANKEKKTEDEEFEQQRQATIAEALQAKEDGKVKSFGGGSKTAQDKDVARIMEMGFSVVEANTALKQNNGNVQEAINSLLNRNSGPPQSNSRERQFPGKDRQGPPGRDRDDRRENFKGANTTVLPLPGEKPFLVEQSVYAYQGNKGRRGRENSENEEVEGGPPSKPSGPATLFDFLETKIKPSKEEKDTEKTSHGSKPLQDSNTHRNKFEGRTNSASYNQDNRRDQGQGQRNRSQNIPPRFSKRDGPPSHHNDSRPYSSPASQNSQRLNDGGQRQNSYDSDRSSRYSDNDYRGQGSNNRGQRSNYDNKSKNQRSKYDGNSGKQSSDYGAQTNSSQNNSYQNRNYENQHQDYQQSRPKSSQNARGDKYSSKGDNYNQRMENTPANYNQGFQGYQNVPPPPLPQQQQQQQYHQPYSYSNQYQQPPPVVAPSPRQQPTNTVKTTDSYPTQWKRGDKCIAKYWEDNRFYNAVIEAVAPNLPTCVVTFVEYGNSEEVNLSDVRPVPKHLQSDGSKQGQSSNAGIYKNQNLPHQQPYATPVPIDNATAEQQIKSMEFRRKKPDHQNNRPEKTTQQYYQPPRQRHQQPNR